MALEIGFINDVVTRAGPVHEGSVGVGAFRRAARVTSSLVFILRGSGSTLPVSISHIQGNTVGRACACIIFPAGIPASKLAVGAIETFLQL